MARISKTAGSDGSMPENGAAEARPPAIPGFEVGPLLGRGAMGSVFRARDQAMARDVAIKVLSATAAQGQRERFQREARALASLRHPNIVTVHAAGSLPSGESYIVMELVEGFTLEAALERRVLGRNSVGGIVAKLARALHAAHALGVVHRDVKPGNVIVDTSGEPRLVDFGLAYIQDGQGARLTAPGVALGTLLYMAPEVLSQGVTTAGPPADVFSLGCVLYEGLAGRHPFESEDRREALARILDARFDPLPENIPAAVRDACVAALARDPAVRPSALALAERLEAALSLAAASTAALAPVSARGSGGARTLLLGATIALVLAAAIAVLVRARPTPSAVETDVPRVRTATLTKPSGVSPVTAPAPAPTVAALSSAAPSPSTLWAQCQDAIVRDDRPAAIALATRGIEICATSDREWRVKFHRARGRTELLAFDPDSLAKAHADLDEALAIEPNDLAALFASFAVAFFQNREFAVKSLYVRIDEVAPGSAESRLAKGLVGLMVHGPRPETMRMTDADLEKQASDIPDQILTKAIIARRNRKK